MSVALKINTFDRGVTEEFRTLERELSPAKLQAVYGPRLREQTRDHLAALPDNKRGYPSTGFWEAAARATRWQPEGDSIRIIVDKIGVRQRYYGGVITPVNKDALTIPISPLSYGKTAKDFPGLFLLKTKKGAYLVMYGNQGPRSSGPKAKRGRGRGPQAATLIFLFKLVGSVKQAPNPNVLPTAAEYRATIFAAVRERLAGIKARKGGVKA